MNIICTQCKGTKKYRDIGCMTMTCSACNGKGSVYKPVEKEPEPVIEEPVKKRGRKKWSDEYGC